MEAKTHQVTIYLDRSEEFHGISSFQLLLIPEKVEDKEAYKTTVNTYQMAKESFEVRAGTDRIR